MYIRVLKSKIHRATVTHADLHYEGSISIDATLIEAAGLIPYEQVDVLNINNGERFTTYVIEGEKDSGVIGINGAAARLAQKGDRVIILSYADIEKNNALSHQPVKILMDENNQIAKRT